MGRPSKIESALPFPPYGQFISFLDDLNAMGVLPNQINASVLKASYSGSAVSQILRAFRFFDLVDAQTNAPAESRLRPLMETASRSGAIKDLLENHYAGLIALPLATAGPAEVNKWFADQGMDSVATRKAKAFFLSAAREHGVYVHALVAEKVPRRGPRGKRKAKTKPREDAANNLSGSTGEGEGSRTPLHPAVKAWIDEMPPKDSVWDRDDFESWLSIFRASVERAYRIGPKS